MGTGNREKIVYYYFLHLTDIFLIKTINIQKLLCVLLNENVRRGKVWGLVCGGDYGGGAYPAPPHTLPPAAPGAAGSALTAGRLQKHVHYQRALSINYLGLTQLKTNHKTNFGK